jgi:hypothetical protein
MSEQTTPGSVTEIRADRDQARRELGDTVERLAAKADVKERARVAARIARDRTREAAGTALVRGKAVAKRRPGAIAGGLSAAAGGLGLVLLVRRRRAKVLARRRRWWYRSR